MSKEINDNEEQLEKYQKIARINGLKNLEETELNDYKKYLQYAIEDTTKSVRVDKCMTFLYCIPTGMIATFDYNMISSLSTHNKPSAGIGVSLLTALLVFSCGVIGAAVEKISNAKAKIKEDESIIESIDTEETYRRMR